ncbi:MAG: hypothetical protein M1818_005859 [Claussenomyces sp. TS43310]|nr:MAG: hypothetical protein M1818_005859 [Claussenomyces sp. TS43310]
MNPNVQDPLPPPPKQGKSGVVNRNTGFSEPLSEDRNTTLPHPSADTSSNAVLESDDLPLSRTMSRTRRSFLSHRSKSNKGTVINPKDMYSNVQYADSGKGTKASAELSRDLGPLEDRAVDGNEDEQGRDSGVAMGNGEREEQGYREGERKKGLLRKLSLYKP